MDPEAVRAADQAFYAAHQADQSFLQSHPGGKLTMARSDEAFRREWMCLYKAELAKKSGMQNRPATRVVQNCPAQKHWVKFVFADKTTGQPFSGIKIKITVPGAKEKEYITGNDGSVSFKDLSDGVCVVSSSLPTHYKKTLAFAGVKTLKQENFAAKDIGTTKSPLDPSQSPATAFEHVANVELHRLMTGPAPKAEKLDDLATANGLTTKELVEFNWGPAIRSTYYRFDLDTNGIVFVPKAWEQKDLTLDAWHIFLCSGLERQALISEVLTENGVMIRPVWGKHPLPDYGKLPVDWWYDTIVIHHTGNEVKPDPLSIEDYHYTEDHFVDVGYHFIIDRSGLLVYEGRDLMFKGDHVALANTGKIGIVLAGDYEHQAVDFSDDDIPAAQLDTLKKLVKSLTKRFPSIKKIGGHRDYIKKSPTLVQKYYSGLCPGQLLYDELPNIRKDTGLGGP